jgi:CHAT domain-containing protein
MKFVSIPRIVSFPAIILLLCGLLVTPAMAVEGAAAPQLSATTTAPAELMTTGRLAMRNGAFAQAAASFEAAATLYSGKEEQSARCEALIRLGQALNFTGQYRKARENGEKAAAIAGELNDRKMRAEALGTVGNALLGAGETGRAQQQLTDALAIARSEKLDAIAAAILTNIGNLQVSQQKYPEALAAFKESAALAAQAGDRQAAAAAGINAATAAVRGGKQAEAAPLLAAAMEHLRAVGDSSGKAFSFINAGLVSNSLRELNPADAKPLMIQAYRSFGAALATAEKVTDRRTASYAYGYLGQLYEDDAQLATAQELTGRAILAAQQHGSAEALYRWHWQNGRISAKSGRIDEAIGSYRHAIRNLQAVREEMSSCYASPESTYQKSASDISAELVDLLLQQAALQKDDAAAEPYLVEARDTLEILKVFELREYFKDDCVDAAQTVTTKLDAISQNTVIIYPILLKDRVELLVSYGQKLKRSRLTVSVADFTKEIRNFRRKLVKRTTWEFLPHAQKLYDWLIRPLEADLAAVKAETLVFVPDGALRSVPMSALHDGTQFLIKRYKIAITPSMNLTDPRPVNREHANMLTVGLTEAVQGFSGLPYVADELQAVRGLYGGQTLLDKDFLLVSLEQQLKKEPYSMIHVATHGQFGSTVGETFILAFDEKFTMDRFGEYIGLLRFRNEPLDLLTLSACETAAGSDRAALGLAGVAVRAGARSALATLWHVNDPASFELIAEFYKQLQNPSFSRAGALQAAQLKLLGDMRYDHPSYWAPFLLINNWL